MGMLFSAAMCYNVGSMCEGSIMMRYPAYPLITIDPYAVCGIDPFGDLIEIVAGTAKQRNEITQFGQLQAVE